MSGIARSSELRNKSPKTKRGGFKAFKLKLEQTLNAAMKAGIKDGSITSKGGTFEAVSIADCLALWFYDISGFVDYDRLENVVTGIFMKYGWDVFDIIVHEQNTLTFKIVPLS